MLYKDNWEDAVQRYEAWHAFEDTGRPLMIVTATARPWQGPSAPADLLARWTDPGYIVERQEAWFRCIHFAGESYPCLWPNLGPGIGGAYLGCEPVFDETTMWTHPIEKPIDEISVEWDDSNIWWQHTLELTRAAVEAGRDKWICGITDLGGVIDIVAGMRHSDRLCMELIESPDEVVRLRDEVLGCWKRAYQELADITHPANNGTTGWLGAFSHLRTYPLQCDFCCMIGPEMFDRFVLPELSHLCRWLDRAVYHLDGPGAIRHLDALLSIRELNGIQWVPGAGQPGVLEWVDLLKRILAAGKCVFAYASPSEVEPLLRQIGSRGVALCVGAENPEQADYLVRMSAEWSAKA